MLIGDFTRIRIGVGGQGAVGVICKKLDAPLGIGPAQYPSGTVIRIAPGIAGPIQMGQNITPFIVRELTKGFIGVIDSNQVEKSEVDALLDGRVQNGLFLGSVLYVVVLPAASVRLAGKPVSG